MHTMLWKSFGSLSSIYFFSFFFSLSTLFLRESPQVTFIFSYKNSQQNYRFNSWSSCTTFIDDWKSKLIIKRQFKPTWSITKEDDSDVVFLIQSNINWWQKGKMLKSNQQWYFLLSWKSLWIIPFEHQGNNIIQKRVH